MSHRIPEWVQPIWNGFGPPVATSSPLLKVFHSAQAWQRFIQPLWSDPGSIVKLDGFDWSRWVLLLMLDSPSGGMETRLVLREAAQAANGKVTIAVDVELDPQAVAGLDIEAQMSMIAKGSRTVFRPDTPVEFAIADVKGTVTHD